MSVKKLSVKTKLGYGIGQTGDSIGYNVFYIFFLFFLTDIAGVSPGIAGTISLIAVLWDAFTDPIIGYLSDNLKSKRGRRRPFMIAGSVPYAICMFLLFTDLEIPTEIKGIYFIIIAMVFWTFYTIYVIPYFALGGEIVEDFGERTSIRAWASIFMYVAVLIASAAPPILVEFTQSKLGGTPQEGWRNVGIVFGLIILAVIFICVKSTKGKEPVWEARKQENNSPSGSWKNIIKSYWEILKLRPVKFLGISIILWSLVCSVCSSGPVYLMDNNLQLSAGKQSMLFTFSSLFAIMWVPVINFLCKKFDKKHVYCYAMLFSGTVLCIFGIIGISGFAVLVAMVFFFTFGNTTFWTLYYSLMYDLNELDQYVNKQRRDGAVAAIMAVCQKLGAALGLQVLGLILQMGGYGQNGGEEKVADFIVYANTFLPGVIGVLAALCVIGYPMTKSVHDALTGAIEKREKGLDYSESDFACVLNKHRGN